MRKISFFLMMFLVIFSCDQDVKLTFETQHIDKSADAAITINYPKAMGTSAVAKTINQQIEHVIANEMNMADTPDNELSISETVLQFDQEYKTFKKEFQDTNQQWEVDVEGKVLYESLEVICISLQSYIDTGGAHGNTRITYLNFNPETGSLLKQNDIISKPDEFKKIAENAFKEQTKPKDNDETIEDFFFGEEFQLAENIGFTKDGLILLYNNYEIASYTQGVTKVVLAYDDIKPFLKVNP